MYIRLVKFILFSGLLFLSSKSHGFVELGTSYNYRQNFVTNENRTITQSLTGSISYYFMANSALEFSFTQGKTDAKFPDQQIDLIFEFVGLDLVFSFGDRGARLRPYIKGGLVHQNKKITKTSFAGSIVTRETKSGVAPSAGLGFKLKLTDRFGLRFGADAWTSPKTEGEDTTWDISTRVGLSWLF